MPVDLRREFGLNERHIARRIRVVGEFIIWYEFLEFGEGSTYDDVYDEGPAGVHGRSYKTGRTIPTIYAEEFEDESRAAEEGRQPTQNLRVTLRLTDVENAAVTNPGEYQPRLNDVFWYDNRMYSVYKYRVTGRMEGEEALVVVDGVEIYPDQDFVLDNLPAFIAEEPTWPDTFPATV